MVYKIKTMLKCLFIFVDQNETKQNFVISSRLVALLLFCSISVSCDLTLVQGLSGLPGFRKTKPAQLLLKTKKKKALSHFEGGSPVKFQGLNIPFQHSRG